MNSNDIPYLRLQNHLLNFPLKDPVEVVRWYGAVQSQDYPGARWAVGMRTKDVKDSHIETLFNEGKILRTHVMRPTWHFVTPEDIRWLLALTSQRVHAFSSHYYKKVGIDTELFNKSIKIFVQALEKKKYLTRDELKNELIKAKLSFDDENRLMRLAYIVMYAELEGIICSGPRKGKQFTYALLEERAPKAKKLGREDSLAELTKRYFNSHGPAQVKDFAWWSGLTMTDVKRGVEINKDIIYKENINGKDYFFSSNSFNKSKDVEAYLLSNYDEYIVAYKDHDAVFDSSYKEKLQLLLPHSIVIDGQVVGGWKRELKDTSAEIKIRFFRKLNIKEDRAVQKAVQKYSQFLAKPVKTTYLP